jgi:heptosyltransferase-2
MPGVRKGILADLPRGRLAVGKQLALAAELRARGYGTALVLPRTWKAAIAPALAGIPERVGFVGEFRFGLINQWRWGEKALPRFIDKNAALALPDGAPLPPEWPVPQLKVPADHARSWRKENGLGSRPAIALGPGSVGASKRWTYYPEAARLLVERGFDVWVVGGPGEKALAREIVAAGGPDVRDLTGVDLRNGILAMAAASVAITNDSGLMHIAAAIGTPTMGIFGPTSPYLWAPLNGLAATVVTETKLSCQPCQRTVCTMNDHRCMRDISAASVVDSAQRVLATASGSVAP